MTAETAMQTFAAADLAHQDRYKLLTGIVVPRPIGWIGTADTEGRPNLAPYSFFQAVASNPPTVLFSAGIDDGDEKDSLVNARTTGEFTFNLVDKTVAEAMNASSAELDRGESEFDFAGLTPVVSTDIAAPRVGEAKAVFECKVTQVVELGNPPVTHAVVFGEVVRFHVAESVLDGTRIDHEALDAIGRMAGNGYITTRDRFDLERPT